MYSTPSSIPRSLQNFTLTDIFTGNFLLSHILPDSLTSQHNFSSESATTAVSSANNSWFISNLPLNYTQQYQPFHKHPCIHLSYHTIDIYILIKQPWRYHTTLSQFNNYFSNIASNLDCDIPYSNIS